MTDTLNLSGPKILLEGPSGTGKSHSLGTLVDWCAKNEIEVFVLFTENSLETLLGYWRDRTLPIPPNLHYHVCHTRPVGLTALMKASEMIGKLTYEGVTKIQDNNRSGDNNSFYKILESISDFPDDLSGKKFGSPEDWPAKSIFVIDSLSELANACMKMVVGNKPTASQPDYGVAQGNLMNFLRLCTQGLKCGFVITAHVDRQTDEILGGSKIMTKSIGKALAGDIPQLFSDVIYTVREGTNWYWDTAAAGVDVKTRSLKYAAKQAPDFAPIMEAWKRRSGPAWG